MACCKISIGASLVKLEAGILKWILGDFSLCERQCLIREGVEKKQRFFGRSLPNVFTHPPTPVFLWDLGKRKVKFGLKKAIFGAIFFFWGFGNLFGNQPPHPPTFGKDHAKKSFFWYLPLNKYSKLYHTFDHSASIPSLVWAWEFTLLSFR